MSTLFAPVFEPGFFADEAVREAILVGTLVAVVAGAVGFFTVMRSQSFAAEALGDLGTAGGSGAFRGSILEREKGAAPARAVNERRIHEAQDNG